MMFNNLIESSSHKREFKRRGSFVLCTTVTYALMLGASGLVSIYAYDAHLDAQTTQLELVMFVPPEEHKEAAPPPKNTNRPKENTATRNSTESVRTTLLASTSNPDKVPDRPGTIASEVPPATRWSRVGSYNSEPVLPTNSGRTNGPGDGNGRQNVVIEDPPPPPPDPPQPPRDRIVKVSRVLNSEAELLPKPKYPQLAIQIHLQGVVNVQVLIDETGKVVSAKAVNGHPILIPEAVRAAMQAKFSPTILGDQPVKVSGVISYNFKLNR
ncbi:MAG TPA: TonB family protein [Pyrinomonadaceae bacterium]